MADPLQRGRAAAKPGAILKACRTERGWTLSDVSQRTGLSVSTLSKVENDRMALTYDKLVRLSEGLEIDLARLFATSNAGAGFGTGATRRSVTRAGEGTSVEMPRGNYLYLAADLLNKQMVPILGEVIARDIDQCGEFMRHPGEEYVYVLEGTLDLHTRMYAPVRLEKGDSVYFDSGMEHAYIAAGNELCRILSICSAPERQLREALESQITTGSSLRTSAVAPASAPRVTRRPAPRPAPSKPVALRGKRRNRRSA